MTASLELTPHGSGALRPIFIHGILPRSGTNFLWDLLLLHPQCCPAVDPVREDLFLDHSDDLIAFTTAVQASWDPRWGEFGPELPARLRAALGEGLLSFLHVDRDRRLVVKNPSVRCLERFFDFFPTAFLIILVRDGRAVTQSCMDTFGWSFERGAREWAHAADQIESFRAAQSHHADRWRLVRYEDLVEDVERELRGLLAYLELDLDCYDMEAARTAPVRGSSVFFGTGRSAVHWEPVPKDSTFSRRERWHSWPQHRRDRFEWIAGEQLRRFGYETASVSRPPRTAAKHQLLDLAWAASRFARDVRRHVGGPLRPLRRRLGWPK